MSDKAAFEGPSSRAVWQGRERASGTKCLPAVGQVTDSSPGRKWDKVPRAHVTQGQAGSSIKLPGDRDVAENSKIKEMTLKT